MGSKNILGVSFVALVVFGMHLPLTTFAEDAAAKVAKTPLELQIERLQTAVQKSKDPNAIQAQTNATTLGTTQDLTASANQNPDFFAAAPVAQPQAAPVAPERPPVRDEAYAKMSKDVLPFNAEQVTSLRDVFNQVQRAQASDPNTPPKPTSRSVIIDMSPGATPQVVRMQSGFVSALVFTDRSGAPWPISAYDLGDPRSFNIQWDKSSQIHQSHILLVQAITMYKRGNLAVLLKDLPTPVMIDLDPGQKAVDYRVDLRIPVAGPNTEITTLSLPSGADSILLEVLNGVPPGGSQRLSIDGFDGDIWYVGGNMYVRTRMTILSPGWKATLSSADGMHAYQIAKTPVILASLHGKVSRLIVKGL